MEANANDSAYQLWQGMLAFGVGGVDGVGLGMGRQQMYFLPEAHTDFIFPVIGEELGLVATLSILIIFLLMFLIVGIKLRQVSRMNEYLLSMGALLFVILQAIINMGVVTGCLPTKGMSLPFISYGGSNLMVTFIFVGLVINVMRRKDHPSPFRVGNYEKYCHCLWGYWWSFDARDCPCPKSGRVRLSDLAFYQPKKCRFETCFQISRVEFCFNAWSTFDSNSTGSPEIFSRDSFIPFFVPVLFSVKSMPML